MAFFVAGDSLRTGCLCGLSVVDDEVAGSPFAWLAAFCLAWFLGVSLGDFCWVEAHQWKTLVQQGDFSFCHTQGRWSAFTAV